MTKIRLQVALAKAGITSRRKATLVIEAGRVKVNGRCANERGFRVDIAKDKVTLDGKALFFGAAKCYYMLNKPRGVVSTVDDERGRRKVTDYVRGVGVRLYPVGRLDKDTTGLIILTDDGDLTYHLTHPKFGVERVYEAAVKGAVREKDLLCLKRGIVLDGKSAKAEKVFVKKAAAFTIVSLTLREGRKREVRRMFGALGYEVSELKRVSYGPLKLKGLKEGAVRPLAVHEVADLKKTAGSSTA